MNIEKLVALGAWRSIGDIPFWCAIDGCNERPGYIIEIGLGFFHVCYKHFHEYIERYSQTHAISEQARERAPYGCRMVGQIKNEEIDDAKTTS